MSPFQRTPVEVVVAVTRAAQTKTLILLPYNNPKDRFCLDMLLISHVGPQRVLCFFGNNSSRIPVAHPRNLGVELLGVMPATSAA